MFEKLINSLRSFRIRDYLTVTAISTVIIIITSVLCANTDVNSVYITLIMVALHLAVSILYLIISQKHSSRSAISSDDEMFMGNMTLELLVKMSTPVVIANQNGIIIWCNSAFRESKETSKVIGMKFSEYTGISLNDFNNHGTDGIITDKFDEKVYSIRCNQLSSNGKKYFVTLWDDNTELSLAKKQIEDENTTVAYVMIDNLEEIAQYTKEGTRSASNEVEKVLTEWASNSSGILKEYQTDRYIFIFRAAEMQNFIEKKFDVLDKIREIRIGESSLSLTVSIGISQISGTLSEKERVAAEALDMALQRGGDQVVLKTEKGLEFYGGKTQTVQKRTKVKARVIANELASLISKSSNVIIMGHKAPDFDSIGACVGIARIAAFCGVKFSIVANRFDPNFKKCFEHISGIGEFSEPDAVINSSDAQEFVGPDTLTVIVDVNNKTQLEAPSVADISNRVVYIDHHRKTAEFDEQPLISYIEPSASSACELIAEILEQSLPAGSLAKEEADIMYSGILLDTKQFTRNAGVRTFGAALYLRGEGANPSDALMFFRADLGEFISEAKFESNVVIYKKIIAISYNEENVNSDSCRISAAKAADKLLSVENVKASFALCRIGEKIHISGRSTGEVNVQLILEKLNGGGHFDSAATQLVSTMTEAMSSLKAAIDEYFSENIGANP